MSAAISTVHQLQEAAGQRFITCCATLSGREEEILEPLIPSILACLDHRHSYVRRNAVLAVAALYRLPKGELLLQDAPDLIEKVIDMS